MARGKSKRMGVSPHNPTGTNSIQKGVVLLLVSDVQIFQEFEEWVASSVEKEGMSLLHVSLNGGVSLDSQGLPEALEVLNIPDVSDFDNEIELTKRTLDALSKMGRFDRVFFDPLSPFAEMFQEDSAPVHIMKELISLLEHRGTLGYFCLSLDSHDNRTIAECKDLADVCIEVTHQDDLLLIQPLRARGIYTKDFFQARAYRNWLNVGEGAQSHSGWSPTICTAVGVREIPEPPQSR